MMMKKHILNEEKTIEYKVDTTLQVILDISILTQSIDSLHELANLAAYV